MKQIFNIPKRFCDFFSLHSEYRIVHCHLNQWCGVVLNGAKKAGIPVRIAHSRTSLETKTLKNLFKNIIKLPVNKYATHRFAVSKKAGIWLYGKKTVKKGNIQIWPNAIDCAKFEFNPCKRNEYRKKLDLKDSFVVIHVGNIRPEKNHKFLIDVFKEMQKKYKNSKLLLVGSDYMSGEIQRYAIEQEINKDVYFLGARSDISNLLQAADVFVFPSLYEGFPGAVLEAQAAGLPCYISDTITEEVLITPHIQPVSLQKKAEEWANIVLSIYQNNIDRKDSSEYILNSGFDIRESSAKITNFYLSQWW